MKIIVSKEDNSVLVIDPDLEQSITDKMEVIEVPDTVRNKFGQSASYKWDARNNDLIVIPISNGPSVSELILSDVKDNYDLAITRLDAIATNGNSFTAAQVRDAMVDLARIERRLLKFIKNQIN